MNFPPHFRSLHSSLFIAFHYLPSPFIAFYRLSSSFITFHRRPISLSAHSLLPRFVLASPHSLTMPLYPRLAPFCPHLAPFRPHLAPFCPHLAPFCPLLAPLSHHATLSSPRPVLSSPCPTLSPFPRFTHLLPSCFITPLCFTHPSFTHHCLRPFVYSLHCFTPLCFALSIVLYPLCFTLSHCFAPVFLLPGNLRKPVPGTAKGNVFLVFQRNFAKSP